MRPLTTRRLMLLVLQAALLLTLVVVVAPFFNPRRVHHGRMQCISNMRQIGLGISGYLNREGIFPPGTIPNPNLPLDRRLGWGFPILPYIDMFDYLADKGLNDKVAAGLAWDDPILADLMNPSPGITRCWISSKNAAAFAAIAGLGVDSPGLPTGHRRAGIFGDERRVTAADIKDGSSTTMMLVESDSIAGPWFAGGRRTVRGLDPFHRPYIGTKRQFGGNHAGGANVLFADGSARFVRDSIAAQIFEALSTMAGGEKIPTDWDD